jgi:hypothetical protein
VGHENHNNLHMDLKSQKSLRRYCELGELLDELARKRGVCGPYLIAQHVEEATDFAIPGSSVSAFLYGDSRPKVGPTGGFLSAFAEAFSLSDEERQQLAMTYSYPDHADWWD